jgi:uncharacterized protein Usg
MSDPVVVKQGGLDLRLFRGGPAEVGRAQGAIDSDYARGALKALLEKPHDFAHPYFRKNMAFMRREFPELMAQMEAFGAGAGIENFDHVYYLHLFHTGRTEEGCSAFGILLKEDGPAMLRTYDPSSPQGGELLAKELYLGAFLDLKPHGFVGMGWRRGVATHTAVNDAGLMVGWASGHPKFNWPDNPEHLNLYLIFHLVQQYCTDCSDVRHFIKQYRISGVKGLTGTAVDAQGNMVGFELESSAIAFREPDEGLLIETNHWQHPDLQVPARAATPDFWKSPYYYNSQNRVQHVAYHRETFKKMGTLKEFVDFSFDVDAPGRIVQMEGRNISNWVSSHAVFMTSGDRRLRVHAYPLDKNRYTEVRWPAS